MATTDRPNFLFLFPDQHRPDFVGGGRAPVRMPNLDRVARAGVRFTRAYTPSPLSAPARACDNAISASSGRLGSLRTSSPSSTPQCPWSV